MSQIISIRPGTFLVSHKACNIVASVESGVLVTFHHPESGIGGMASALYPKVPRRFASPDRFMYYVDHCITSLCKDFHKNGIPSAETQVCMYGGAIKGLRAKIFPNSHIGLRNVRTAAYCLAQQGYSLSESHTGGHGIRTVSFESHTGKSILQVDDAE